MSDLWVIAKDAEFYHLLGQPKHKDRQHSITIYTFPDPTWWYLFSSSFWTGSSSTYVTKQNPLLSLVLVSIGSSMLSIWSKTTPNNQLGLLTERCSSQRSVRCWHRTQHRMYILSTPASPNGGVTYCAESSEIFPDLILWRLRPQAPNKDLPGRLLPLERFSSFRINKFSIKLVLFELQHLKKH